MRWVLLVLFAALIGCGSQDDGGDAAPYAAAQKVVDGVAARHAKLQRLTLHAVPTDGAVCTQVASTKASRRGKPSDPEDLEALRTGKETVLDEPGAIDVTVPILVKDGKPGAVAGVTLRMEEGADRDALVAEARAIADELAKEVEAATTPLW